MTAAAGRAIAFGDVLEGAGWVLAIETSGPEGSLAVGRGGIAEASGVLRPRRQASDLLPELEGLLGGLGISVRDLRGLVVGAGPGSFTGVRVAAATAKGLWHGLGVPVWPVSSLRGAACDPTAPWTADLRGVLFDARGDRTYAAVHVVSASGVEERIAPFAADLGDVLERLAAAGVHAGAELGGSAVWRHRSRISEAGFACADPPAGRPTAAGLLESLRLDPDTGAHENPAQWEPEYLRASSAERSRPGIDAFDSGP